jgi:hypothetical protein
MYSVISGKLPFLPHPHALRAFAPLHLERGKEPPGFWGEVCSKKDAIRPEGQLS